MKCRVVLYVESDVLEFFRRRAGAQKPPVPLSRYAAWVLGEYALKVVDEGLGPAEEVGDIARPGSPGSGGVPVEGRASDASGRVGGSQGPVSRYFDR